MSKYPAIVYTYEQADEPLSTRRYVLSDTSIEELDPTIQQIVLDPDFFKLTWTVGLTRQTYEPLTFGGKKI